MSLAGKITLFVGVAAGASAGAAAWAWQHDPPPSPADTTPPTPAPEAVPTVIRGVGNESGASLGRRTWAARRTAIRGALPPVDQTPPTVESSDPQAQPGWIDVGSFARACVEDLAPETNAALTVDVTVVGSPETGVIVDSVDLIETTIRDPAVLECIAESIYTHVGKPPAKPFSKTTRASLAVGDSHESDAKQQRMFEAIVGAHIGEVHYCQNEKATGPVQGTLPVRFTIVPNAEFGSAGRVERTDAGETTIEAAVVDCTLAAARRWMFPVALAGKTVTYTYTFPIPAGRIVVPSARE